MKYLLRSVLSGFILVAAAAAARGDVIDLLAAANGSGPGGYAGKSTWSITTASGVLVTFQALPSGAKFTYNMNSIDGQGDDGMGIDQSYEDDEVESPERLKITFSTPVVLKNLMITDLFYEERSGRWYQERGWYDVLGDGLSAFSFTAPTSNLPFPATNGEMTIGVDKLVTSLELGAPGKVDVRISSSKSYQQDHEFSLAGLEFAVPIPEPMTLALFGPGALALLAASRRRRPR